MSFADTTAAEQPAPLVAERPHSQAHTAMWLTLRRVTVLAALTDAGYFVVFWAIGSPVLQWINLVSIPLYALAWRLSRDRLHPASVWLMWIEVLGHAALGSLVIGWASGFHYFLMMFIPGIAASTRPRRSPRRPRARSRARDRTASPRRPRSSASTGRARYPCRRSG